MRNLKVKWAAFVLAISLAVSLAAQVSVASGKGKAIMEFESMVGVSGPYVGAANPIRGINGGGIPWAIANGNGELQANGHLQVHVRGLVLAAGPKVGTNPAADFKAIVSCLSISNGSPETVNVSTGLFPATTTGNAEINAQVTLPNPCIAPIIFVTSPTGSWFATIGN